MTGKMRLQSTSAPQLRHQEPPANSRKWLQLLLLAVATIAFVLGGVQLMQIRMEKRLQERLQILNSRRAEVMRQANLAQPAAPAVDPHGAAPEIEQMLLSKCGQDPKFCHFTGTTYEHENALVNALHFYEKSCEFNYGPACASLAAFYLRGAAVAKAPAMALELYIKSCENKAPEGCLVLGKLYQEGQIVALSFENARVTFEKGCTLENAESCYELALHYSRTAGTPATKQLATTYYERACRLNSSPACKTLDFQAAASAH